MNPITHFFISWVVANSTDLSRKDRAVVTVAGVIPDIDGLGIIAEKLTQNSEHPLFWWTKYHHVLCHNIGFGIMVTAASFTIATKRWKTAVFAFITFNLHLLCDIVGARGPDGYQWPIPYLLPFSSACRSHGAMNGKSMHGQIF